VKGHESGGLIYVNADQSGNVADSGGTETYALTAPLGFMYIVRGLYYKAVDPVGSTAGTHEIEIRNTNGYVSHAFVKANTGSDAAIIRNIFYGDASEVPSGAAEQFKICNESMRADAVNTLDFIYSNDTDATQTANRILRILVEKIRV